MQMPGGLSSDAYVDKRLRPLDSEHYSAAGILPYRRRAAASVELLLPRERPWNSFTQSYDPISWNLFGSKRVPRMERSAETTAVRSFIEAVGQVPGAPSQDDIYSWLPGSFIVWYPMGKFALLVFEVPEDKLTDFTEQYAEHRKVAGTEEFRILPQGIKKWQKQIDGLEWVPASSLVPEPASEVSDLLANILQAPRFREFLDGSFDPSTVWPPLSYEIPRPPSNSSKGKGKSGGKEFMGFHSKAGMMKGYTKGMGDMGNRMDMGMGMTMGDMGRMSMGMGMESSGYGKGSNQFYGKGMGKDYGNMMLPGYSNGMNPSYGTGINMDPSMSMSMYQGKGMLVAPMAFQASYQQNSEDMQRQLYGEQLYILVQNLSPSPYLAQKITGMLLELPQNELVLNLTDAAELQRRVGEAMEVLKEDGVVS